MNENPSPFPSPTASPQQGLSTASLVLGICSVAGCTMMTGIPAIITGHIARSRARRQPEVYGGAGLALVGLILGYLGTALTIVVIAVAAAVALPALAKGKSRAQTVNCVNNLKQVCLAARIWANDHGDVFPPDIVTMSNELYSPKILVCPGDPSKIPATDWNNFSPAANVTYEFLMPGAKESAVMSQPVFRCPIHGNIGLGDGSVQQGRKR
jgi:hypothetical protein